MSKQKGNIEVNDEELKELDLSKFRPSTSSSVVRRASSPGDLTIVNTTQHGKRLAISKEVLNFLGNPPKVQFMFTKKRIIIGALINGDIPSYPIKDYHGKGILYAGRLVDEITSQFKLNFEGRSSITLPKSEKRVSEGKRVALICVLPKEENDEQNA